MVGLGCLAGLRRDMETFLSGFDPGKVTEGQLCLALDDAIALSSMFSHLVTLLVSRDSENDPPTDEGQRSAAHRAARMLGSSVTDARRRIATGQAISHLPQVSKAACSGALSPRQVEIIADAARENPAAEGLLLEAAFGGSIASLSDAAGRAKAEVRNAEETHRKAHERRSLRSFPDGDGGYKFVFTHTNDVGAEIGSTISEVADRLFDDARGRGTRESPDAYRADALVEIVRSFNRTDNGSEPSLTRATTSRPVSRTKIIVRVDSAVLERGSVKPGEICDISGVGPVAPSVVRRMIEKENPFLAAVITSGKEVTKVVHLGRKPTALQRTALDWMYPTCAVAGCTVATHLEIDHRHDWSKTHRTEISALDRLCTHHHDLKTKKGWALVSGTGKRAFVAPGDPRHPYSELPRAG